jgi:hypothetical protein
MMREPKTKLPFLLAGGVAMLGLLSIASPSDASVSIAMTIDDLAKGSSVVLRATPLDQTSAWENGRIVTSTRMHVDRVVAGSAPSSSEVHVQTLGGIVGDIGQIVDGEASFVSKPSNNSSLQSSIVFLMPRTEGNKTHYVVNGRAQGQLLVLKDVKTNREIVKLARTGPLVPRTRILRSADHVTPAMMTFDGHDADEVSNEAARAWERTHATR